MAVEAMSHNLPHIRQLQIQLIAFVFGFQSKAPLHSSDEYKLSSAAGTVAC